MTSVLLVLFLSQARIFMAMARDGLLPRVFGTVHPRFRTPHIATMVTGAVICVVAALTPIQKLEEMVNIGTLMAFVMVCAAVLILRVQRPDAQRPFRCPAIWLVAPLGILVNVVLMLFLPLDTWLRLVIWLVVGLVIYFTYSRRHSHLTPAPAARDPDAPRRGDGHVAGPGSGRPVGRGRPAGDWSIFRPIGVASANQLVDRKRWTCPRLGEPGQQGGQSHFRGENVGM